MHRIAPLLLLKTWAGKPPEAQWDRRALEREWDRQRAKAHTDRERAEIDAIFSRY